MQLNLFHPPAKTINYPKFHFHLDPTLYAQKACYNGFRTTVDRLPVWIQAIYEKVYIDIGNQPE